MCVRERMSLDWEKGEGEDRERKSAREREKGVD